MGGTEDSACGTGGQMCADCGAGYRCTLQGTCVSADCASTCNGCCLTDGTCKTGSASNACGAGGDACVDCGSHRTCQNAGCVVDQASTWELILVSGQVSLENPMGQSWDFIGLPDPLVDFDVADPTTGVHYRATSSFVQDDDTPAWNESELTGVPARAFQTWSMHVWDSDYDANDSICEPIVDYTGDQAGFESLFDGQEHTASCSVPNTNVFANITFKLLPD